MKIYIISDTPEYGIAASNFINRNGHVAILSETVTQDQRELLGDLRGNVGGSFDIVLLICENAKDIAISANKIGGAMAVVCKDQDDALDAISSTRANVVIIDSTKVTKSVLTSILGGLLADQEQSAPTPVKRREPAHHQEKEIHTPAQRPVVAPPRSSGGGGSLFSGLKNSLGMGEGGAAPDPQPRAMKSAPMPKKPRAPIRMPIDSDTIKSVKSKGMLKSLKDALGVVDEDK